MIVENRRAGLGVFRVGKARAGTGVTFHEHLMPTLDELVSCARQERHAELLFLNFYRYPDDHLIPFRSVLCRLN